MPQAKPAPQTAQPRKRTPYFRYLTIALLICCLPFFALGATIAATGTMMVDIEENSPDGVSLWVPVPVLLLDLAVFAAPMIIPDDAMAEMQVEIAPFLPGIEQFVDTLEDAPDGVIVEVESEGEHILITKKGRSLTVSVDSSDADINISMPLRVISRSLDLFS